MNNITMNEESRGSTATHDKVTRAEALEIASKIIHSIKEIDRTAAKGVRIENDDVEILLKGLDKILKALSSPSTCSEAEVSDGACVDVEALKMKHLTRGNMISDHRLFEIIEHNNKVEIWNECIEYLLEQGIIKGDVE